MFSQFFLSESALNHPCYIGGWVRLDIDCVTLGNPLLSQKVFKAVQLVDIESLLVRIDLKKLLGLFKLLNSTIPQVKFHKDKMKTCKNRILKLKRLNLKTEKFTK